MLLNIDQATEIVREQYPDGEIQASISYKDLYLFQVFSKLPDEEQWDPFYSVNKQTGEFQEFSIITDGDTAEIVRLFQEGAQ